MLEEGLHRPRPCGGVEIDGDQSKANVLQELFLNPEDCGAKPERRHLWLSVHQHAAEDQRTVLSESVDGG